MISSVLINTIKIFNPSTFITDFGPSSKILVVLVSQLQKELKDSRGKWEVCTKGRKVGGWGEGSESIGGQVSPHITCPLRLMVVVVVVVM